MIVHEPGELSLVPLRPRFLLSASWTGSGACSNATQTVIKGRQEKHMIGAVCGV